MYMKYMNRTIKIQSDGVADLSCSIAVFWYIFLSLLSSSMTPSSSTSALGPFGLMTVIFSTACLFFKSFHKKTKNKQTTYVCVIDMSVLDTLPAESHLSHVPQGSSDAGVVLAAGCGDVQGLAGFGGFERDVAPYGWGPQRAQRGGGFHAALTQDAPPACLEGYRGDARVQFTHCA